MQDRQRAPFTHDNSRETMHTMIGIGHDLRAPLSVILGASQLMEYCIEHRGQDAKGFLSYVDIIRKNGKRLLRMVNNMLDMARMESGEGTLYVTCVNVGDLVFGIAKSIEPYAIGKGIAIRTAGTHSEILAALDGVKVERMLLNLLSNAIKHTPPGGEIELCVSSDECCAYLFVTDTGEGMDQEMLDIVFTRYATKENRSGSTGIGLPLVKAMAELHGGSIAVESLSGCGSTFCLRLPKGSVTGLRSFSSYDALPEMAQLEMSDMER